LTATEQYTFKIHNHCEGPCLAYNKHHMKKKRTDQWISQN